MRFVSFQSIQPKLGKMFIRIEHTIRFGCCIISFYPAIVLKNRGYVSKKCLDKHDLNCAVQQFFLVLTQREHGLDAYHHYNQRYDPL